MEGTVIGSYRVVRKLGVGGMGAVYLAEHTLIGRRAAIKVLLPALSARPDIVDRFFNEARAAGLIADPGIVQIFDFGYHEDGSAYIVMEYLDGETLDVRLRRLGRLPVVDALRIVRQIASSLAAAHGKGIVHRDLKPENIFLVRDGEVAGGERPKLLDFGIAKLSDDDNASKIKTRAGAIIGTPVYMSPEQCRAAGEVDHRADVYALGCVLYHLMVGRPPFDGESMGDVIAMHLREPAPVASEQVPEVPPDVDQIILCCLAKVAEDRFQSMDELAAAIGIALPELAPGGTVPSAPGATPSPHTSGSRHQALGSQPTVDASETVDEEQLTSHERPSRAAYPTTIGSSSGELHADSRRGRNVRRLATAFAIAAALGAAAAITHRRATATAPSEPPPALTPARVLAPAPEPPPAVTAAPAPAIEPPDAGVPPAQAAPAPSRPATTIKHPKPKPPRPPIPKRPPPKPPSPGDPDDLDGDGIPDRR